MIPARTDQWADDQTRACAGRKPTRKPKPKERRVTIRLRVKPSVKAMAERLAQKAGRSMDDWLERLIARERARHVRKRKETSGS
jgi:predicted HicB family RNase H-like nuclease